MTEPSQTFTHHDYSVGWICALPTTELMAAMVMLDEEHPVLPAADPQHDPNSFPDVGSGLMVGILGGALYYGVQANGSVTPTEERVKDSEDSEGSEGDIDNIRDIRLGDVVISLHSNSSDAVMQYNFGKSLQEKGFISYGTIGLADQEPGPIGDFLQVAAEFLEGYMGGSYEVELFSDTN
ncbi:G-protein beta WD-40 repeats containing protein [Aspergillus lentulus]|uniref:G-protein beta WD-40 repeats containing protein, partial n=1 Tax=Aspergillus lentulus TaxID=293939 RepID=A0ABQ1ASN3_ASPLE|nr:G-protein beta WD-40 repeats containing protein [Aspergillus lentulus]